MWAAGCFLLIALLGTRQPLRGFLPRIVVDHRSFWTGIAALFVGGLLVARAGLPLRALATVLSVSAFHGLSVEPSPGRQQSPSPSAA